MNGADLSLLLRKARIVPILSPDSVDAAVDTVDILIEAGIDVVEIVLRNPTAAEALQTIRQRHRGLTIAAGTVLDGERYEAAMKAGAHFAVSPGLEPSLAAHARRAAIPLVPGAQTASEVMSARAAGFAVLKFYPAVPANGAQVLSDFANVFPDVAFMPTGKLNAAVLPDYAMLSNVACVGGSWMFSEGGGRLARDEIVARVHAALAIMKQYRR